MLPGGSRGNVRPLADSGQLPEDQQGARIRRGKQHRLSSGLKSREMLFPKKYPVRPSVRCNHVICGLEKTNIQPVGAWRFRDRRSGCHYAKRQGAVVAGLSSELDLHELTRLRAEAIYLRNGRIPGRDVENWTQAEQ